MALLPPLPLRVSDGTRTSEGELLDDSCIAIGTKVESAAIVMERGFCPDSMQRAELTAHKGHRVLRA
ncbi:hypothetical protein HAL1_00645 [Halomonas sp. HAL1]|nr:hypothetical protein HAL1_00645 [Halomonas sp. HAL1]